MQRSFIISLILAVLLIIFVLMNMQIVTIRLFFWPVQGSLVLILFLVALAAAITSALLSLSRIKRIKKELRTRESEVKDLSQQLELRDKEIAEYRKKVEKPNPPVSPPSQP